MFRAVTAVYDPSKVSSSLMPSPPLDPLTVAQDASAGAANDLQGDNATTREGLIVCDPVIAGSPSLTDFGVGCGRWLDFIAAGQARSAKRTAKTRLLYNRTIR